MWDLVYGIEILHICLRRRVKVFWEFGVLENRTGWKVFSKSKSKFQARTKRQQIPISGLHRPHAGWSSAFQWLSRESSFSAGAEAGGKGGGMGAQPAPHPLRSPHGTSGCGTTLDSHCSSPRSSVHEPFGKCFFQV